MIFIHGCRRWKDRAVATKMGGPVELRRWGQLSRQHGSEVTKRNAPFPFDDSLCGGGSALPSNEHKVLLSGTSSALPDLPKHFDDKRMV